MWTMTAAQLASLAAVPANPEPPGLLDDLTPSDPLMRIAWADCLRWAMRQDNVLDAFRADTGTTDAVFADALNAAKPELARSFVAWFNDNVWGDLDIVAGECPDEDPEAETPGSPPGPCDAPLSGSRQGG